MQYDSVSLYILLSRISRGRFLAKIGACKIRSSLQGRINFDSMIFFFFFRFWWFRIHEITDDRWNNSFFVRKVEMFAFVWSDLEGKWRGARDEWRDPCILIASISRSISARFIAPRLFPFLSLFPSSSSPRNAKDRCNNNLLNSDEAKWFIDKRNKLYSPPRGDIFPSKGREIVENPTSTKKKKKSSPCHYRCSTSRER